LNILRLKTVVINRQDRPERLRKSQEQFAKYGMEVEVFPAITEPRGWRGCRDSHLAVLEKYKDEELLLVFEDDVLFLGEITKPLNQVINELPVTWDIIYLGISPQEIYKQYSMHSFRVKKGYCAHAVLYHNKPDSAVEYILKNRDSILKYDVFLSERVHPLFNCFVIYPILCLQRQEKSDTCLRSDASSIMRNYQKYIHAC